MLLNSGAFLLRMRMLVSLGLLVMASAAVNAFTQYDSCLFQCLNCVESWGKKLYDGQACAHECEKTNGHSIDQRCLLWGQTSKKRTQDILTSDVCEERCERCQQGGNELNLKRLSCVFTCLVNKRLPSEC